MELWDVLDAQGNKTGRTIERGQPLPEGGYHLIVDVWIVNGKGDLLISRRAPHTQPDAGMWEPTCGCAIAGDDSLSAALREVREELGVALDPENGKRFKRFTFDDYPAFVDVWLFNQDIDIGAVTLQPEEVDDAMWADVNAVKSLRDEGRFISSRRMPYLDELLKIDDGAVLQ